jgi:hypothetical protein
MVAPNPAHVSLPAPCAAAVPALASAMSKNNATKKLRLVWLFMVFLLQILVV